MWVNHCTDMKDFCSEKLNRSDKLKKKTKCVLCRHISYRYRYICRYKYHIYHMYLYGPIYIYAKLSNSRSHCLG